MPIIANELQKYSKQFIKELEKRGYKKEADLIRKYHKCD